MTTIRLKLKSKVTNHHDFLNPAVLERICHGLGISKVSVTDSKAYLIFRHRDTTLKVFNMLTSTTQEMQYERWQAEFDHERTLMLRDFKLKVVSTSAAERKDDKHKRVVTDSIEGYKDSLSYESRVMLKSMTLEQIEAKMEERLRVMRGGK